MTKREDAEIIIVERADAADKPSDDASFEPDVPELTQQVMQAWMQHEIGSSLPTIPGGVTPDIEATPIDVAIAERLLAAYSLSDRERTRYFPAAEDMWSSIGKLQQKFFALLASGNPEALAAYLCNMARHDGTIGITQGVQEHDFILSHPDYAYFRRMMIKDKMISFAEATGAINYECPEQGPCGEYLHGDIDVLLQKLEAKVGISLTPPAIDGAMIKVPAGGGLFHDRDLYAQFTAWSMRELVGPGAPVCEIGGGVGRCAYWAQRFGLGRYTLIDLPHINVLQGYYLIKSLPENTVALFGESVQDANVRVVPSFAKDHATEDEVEIVLAQDCLPEFHKDIALDYIAWSRRFSRTYLYSINQEGAAAYTQDFCAPADENDPKQNVVRELVAQSGGFRNVMRAPYWLRKGYAAELFKIVRPGSIQSLDRDGEGVDPRSIDPAWRSRRVRSLFGLLLRSMRSF